MGIVQQKESWIYRYLKKWFWIFSTDCFLNRSTTKKGLCFQGFVELFTKLSRLIFDEKTLEQCLKSLIYYCKLKLKQDGSKSNQFFSIEMNDSFHQLAPRIENEIQMLRYDYMSGRTSNFSRASVSTSNSVHSQNLIRDTNMGNDVIKAKIGLYRSKSLYNNKSEKKTIFPIFFDTTVWHVLLY